MESGENCDELNEWLQYTPEETIRFLQSDVKGFISIVKSIAELMSIDPNAQAVSLSGMTLPELVKLLIDASDKLLKTLDIVTEASEIRQKSGMDG